LNPGPPECKAEMLTGTFSIEKINFGEMTGGMEGYVLLCARGIETPTDMATQFVSNSIC
jgi:hypothetical protein